MDLREIDVSQIVEPVNAVRTEIDDRKLEELAASIQKLGLLQPIVVKEHPDGVYEVVAGHRRLLAIRRLQRPRIACYVKSAETPDEAVQIHENIEREELNPADEALRYMELYEKLNDTQAVADLVRKPLEYVERRMNLLFNADLNVFEALRKKEIAIGVAEELNKMELETDRAYHLHFARTTGTTVRQMRDYRIRANANAERDRALKESSPPPAGEEPAPAPSSPPAREYLGYAKPYELSAAIDPRPCLFCARQFPEHQMFRKWVCGECADKHLVPIEKERV